MLKPLNPFKSRAKSMSDVKLVVNPYRGCPYKCMYCYIYGYMRSSYIMNPTSKRLFKRRLRRDLKEYSRLRLPKYPVYLSSSCEPLNPQLERIFGNTLYALRLLGKEGFPVVIVTKNPCLLLRIEYLEALDKKASIIQVSVPFMNNRFEPETSLPIGRIWAASKLVREGFKVVLRVEPLIPSYGWVSGQSELELEVIVSEARKAGVKDIFSKCLLLPIGVNKLYPEFYRELKPYYVRHGYKNKTYYVLNYRVRVKLLMALYAVCRRNDARLWTCLNNSQFSDNFLSDELEHMLHSTYKL